MNKLRYWIVVCLLAGTAVALNGRGNVDRVPQSEPLETMPTHIGPWSSRDEPIDDQVLQILGKGEFLNRVYETTDPANRIPSVGLFIGYFPTQRTGQTIHSPQHCLPGAGWTFESSRYTNMQAADGKNFNIGEYVISNGEVRQFVLYWYQAHGRSVANEYVSKAYLIADAIRLNRTDGALVRVITPIGASEQVGSARDRALIFAKQMATELPRIIPS